MEEKERYEIHIYDDICVDLYDNGVLDKSINDTYKLEELLNQQSKRLKEFEQENQQLKDQARKAYQEGLLQKQFDKDMEIQELKDKIEFLTTFKEVISEHKPAFCKLAGRDCEWLGKEKQLAISELENLKEKAFHFYVNDTPELTSFYVDVKEIDNQIKAIKGDEVV